MDERIHGAGPGAGVQAANGGEPAMEIPGGNEAPPVPPAPEMNRRQRRAQATLFRRAVRAQAKRDERAAARKEARSR